VHSTGLARLGPCAQAMVVMVWREGSGDVFADERLSNVQPQVSELTTSFLTAADRMVPGFIQGLYLTGSVALGDFHSHCSDIDFVAVSEGRPDDVQLEGLAAVHASLRGGHPNVHFDGTHLSWSALAAGPDACGPGPFSYGGTFERSGTFALNPVTWHELVEHGLALRGPSILGAPIWFDNAVLKAWTLNNLIEYWRPWTVRYRESSPDVDRNHDLVCWGVLGVARLHYTAATSRITSKTGAGQYALKVFEGRWRRIISEALQLRAAPTVPSDYSELSERRRDVIDFMDLAIESALKASAV
jgi:hypothetical protein